MLKDIVLPTKLSDLLELSLRDLKRCEEDPKYYVNMEAIFHDPKPDVCSVCLAGAVMAQTFLLDNHTYSSPSSEAFHPNRRQLFVLDYLRQGKVFYAAQEFGRSTPSHLDREVADYGDDADTWHEDMRKLLNDLREAGL